MVVSREWMDRYHKLSAKDRKAAFHVHNMIHNETFWKEIACVIVIFEPLVKVLRMVDSDGKAEMGFLYEAMDRAKETIRRNVGKGYKKWWEIIDRRWDKQLHRDILAAGYFLNPKIQYSSNATNDEVLSGLRHVVGRLEPDISKQLNIHKELDVSTKLCIRESLYRLARSARQRQGFTTQNYSKGIPNTKGIQDTEASESGFAEFMDDVETNTNPLDRSIAHWLFHMPSERAIRSADIRSLEPHVMNEEVLVPNQFDSEGIIGGFHDVETGLPQDSTPML